VDRPKDERTLVELARAGNAEAVGSLYEHYANRIFRYVFLRVGNSADAEDITEQVFLKVIEGISGFTWQGKSSFSAWLYRIAHNLVVDAVRRSATRPQVRLDNVDNALLADVGDPHRYAEIRDFLSQVNVAMGELTDLQTRVLLLRYGAELSVTEVAQVLERTPALVSTVQYQALRKLNSLLRLKGYKHL
jgi:RNA polymerase sigma-70 factor (ECF subfamily)